MRSTASRGQARSDRQLPGRLGGHVACRDAPGAFRSDHRRGITAILLDRWDGKNPKRYTGGLLGLLLDERRAVDAIPAMLAKDQKLAASLAETLRQLLGVVGIRTAAAKARLREIEAMFKSIGRLAPADMAKAQIEAVSPTGTIPFGAPSAFDCSLAYIQM